MQKRKGNIFYLPVMDSSFVTIFGFDPMGIGEISAGFCALWQKSVCKTKKIIVFLKNERHLYFPPHSRNSFIKNIFAAEAAVYFLTAAILLNFLVVVKILMENYINFLHRSHKGKCDHGTVIFWTLCEIKFHKFSGIQFVNKRCTIYCW